MVAIAPSPETPTTVVAVGQVVGSAEALWIALATVAAAWWVLSSREGGRDGGHHPEEFPAAPSRVDPPSGVAEDSPDSRDDRDGLSTDRGDRFDHEVVGHRGEDRVVEVRDDDRSARFLVRSTDRGNRLVSPADSIDRHHDEEWLRDASGYLRTAKLTRWAELEPE